MTSRQARSSTSGSGSSATSSCRRRASRATSASAAAATELGIVAADWPEQHYGRLVGDGVRFELVVYVAGLDACVEGLREAGIAVLREPEDMPWGERIAYVTDPDGNPVTLAEG